MDNYLFIEWMSRGLFMVYGLFMDYLFIIVIKELWIIYYTD